MPEESEMPRLKSLEVSNDALGSMGHDVHVHHKTYQAFITEQSFLEVYRRIVKIK